MLARRRAYLNTGKDYFNLRSTHSIWHLHATSSQEKHTLRGLYPLLLSLVEKENSGEIQKYLENVNKEKIFPSESGNSACCVPLYETNLKL